SAQIPAGRVAGLTRAASREFVQGGDTYPLSLRTIVPFVDPLARTREVRLTFTAAKPVPGSGGRLVWRDPRPHLPPWILVQRDKTLGVFLARDGKAHFHPFPEAMEGHPAPVETSLQGDLILSGREGLSHGDPVQTLPDP
ncbi:MAG: hypothetical protein HQM02_11215, partial [Magnetococcales bacterium]|nr:hypothetical protein [Magnetococcales bacterium]